jgi:hypothetical protein
MEVKDRIALFSRYKARRSNWDTTWQVVAEYVNVRKANFTVEREEGTFLNTDLFDNSAQLALNSRSSTLVALLWDGGKFSYRPNPELFDDSMDENDWFEYATTTTQREFKRIGANATFFESEMDEGAYGSSYSFLDGGEEGEGLNLILFQVKEVYVDETKKNKVNVVYRDYKLGVREAVDTFGLENVSSHTRQLFNDNKFTEKVHILHIIQPRLNRDQNLQGKDNMPYESVYIDLKNKHEMKKQGVQGGFRYFPVYVSREGKKNGEMYGRSPSMMAISDISQLNKVREDQIIILNRMADPAIGYDSTSLQGNIIDTSPGSATAFKMMGRASSAIFDMVPTKGDARATEEAIVRLQESINGFYGIDRLLDFNKDTEMTLGEAQIRAQIRQQSLGSLLSKKRNEKYEPIVKRAFAILFEQGRFGLMPDDPSFVEMEQEGIDIKKIPEDIAEKLNDGYDITDLIDVEFYTQFELEKKLLENNTILQVWNNAGLIAQLTQNPEVFDNLDYDKTIKAIGRVSVDIDIFREQEEVKKIRKERQQAQQAQDMLGAGKELSEIDKNMRRGNE